MSLKVEKVLYHGRSDFQVSLLGRSGALTGPGDDTLPLLSPGRGALNMSPPARPLPRRR